MCPANLKQGDTDTSASTGTLGAKAISVPQIQALPERGEGGVDVMVHSEISHRSRPNISRMPLMFGHMQRCGRSARII